MGIFYRKTDITNDGYFDQRYPDLSDGQNPQVLVSGGVRDRIGFWNTQVSTRPQYGDATLIGTRLWLYAESLKEITGPTGKTDGTTAKNADFMLWKTKGNQDANITEGGTSPNCEDILTFSSYIGDTETQDFDALDGTNFYTGSASRVASSISADYKVVLEGERITIEDFYQNQKGWVGTKLTRNAIFARYYVPPKESVRIHGRRRSDEFNAQYSPTQQRLLDLGRGTGMGLASGAALAAATTMSLGGVLIAGGAIAYGVDQAERIYSQTTPDMSGAHARSLWIYMEKMPGYESNISAVTASASGKGNGEVTEYLSDGASYWGGKTKDWGSAVGRTLMGDGDGVEGLQVAAGDVAQAVVSTQAVKKKWRPKSGTGRFTDDIYVLDEDVTIKYEKSEEVTSVNISKPDFTGLQLPPEDSIITTSNTIFTQIRTSRNYEFTITNAEDATVSNPSGKVPISMSNFAFVDKSVEGTGSKMAMMECLHAFYEHDGTPARHLKSVNGDVDYLQEVRAQMYCPAPLNIDGSDDNDQFPFIQFTGQLELPGAPYAYQSNYITMRRALFLGFNRYAIGKDNDILKVVDVAGVSSTSNAYEGCNGFFIHEWPTLNNNEYYAVTWIGDLDHTNAGDPRLKISGGSEKFPKAWIAKDDLANNECVFRFYCTPDGVKMVVTNGAKSILRSVHTDGTLANAAYEDGRLPYISLSGHEKDDGSSKYDNLGEWSMFRKYHIKSGIMGTKGTTNMNVWNNKNSPGSAVSFTSHADVGINGQNSAGLNMMWLPYLTIALTSTRINGDKDRSTTDWSASDAIQEIYARESADYGLRAKKIDTGASNPPRPNDVICRFYIDNIGTYRFNYKHQNATINANNLAPGKITLPIRSKFGTIKLSDKGIPALTANRATHNAEINVQKDNYAYISLGFKNRVEAESSKRWLLFNGFICDSSTVNNPTNTNNLGIIYSDDSHPLGEYHTSYPFGEKETTWTNSFYATNGLTGNTPLTAGLPYMSYCMFGDNTHQRRRTHDVDLHGGDVGFWNFQALKDDDDYDARGINRVEEFSQSGLVEFSWNSHHFNEWDSSINVDNSYVCCGSAAVDHSTNINAPNASTLYDYHSFKMDDSSNDDLDSNASFGTQEAEKSPTLLSNWIGPNLNWLVYFKDYAGSASKSGNGSGGTSTIGEDAVGYDNFKNSAAVIGALSGGYIHYSDLVVNGQANVHIPNGADIALSPGMLVKRENPFVQSRIFNATKIDDNVWEVTVDSEKPLQLDEDEQFLVYHGSREWCSTFEPQAVGKLALVHDSGQADGRNYYHDAHLTQNSPTARTQMVLERSYVATDKFKLVAHGLVDNQKVQFNGFNLVTGITNKQDYYVKKLDNDYFQIKTSSSTSTAVTLGGNDDYDILISFDNLDDHVNPTTYGKVGWGKEIDDVRRQNKYCVTIVKAERVGEARYRLTGQDTAAIIGGDATYTLNTNSANVYLGDYQTDPASSLDEIIYSVVEDMKDADGNIIGNEGYSNKPVPMGRFLNTTLCISPWRYWLTVKVPLHDYERAYSAILDIYSTTDSDFSEAAGTAGCALQSTYHESTYTDSHKYTNYWNWNREPDSIIETNVDYGFGALDAETSTGGHAGQQQLISGWNEIPFDGAAMAANVIENQPITLVGTSTEDASVLMSFSSSEATDTQKRPFMVSVFQDPRPATPSDFMVQPDETNPFYPRYSWVFNDDDIWYGFLIIDDSNITNQYHGSVLHIPLNWQGNTTSFGPKYYTNMIYKGKGSNGYETQSGYMTEAGTIDHAVDGLQGFAVEFDGVDDYLTMPHANVWENAQPTTEMSIVLHVKPKNTPSADEYIIYKEKEIEVWLDSNQQLYARIYPDTGAALTSTDIPVEVKSTSIIPCNDEIPTNVIITLDAGLKSGNVKLYINGKLEDITGLRKTDVSKNNWPTGKSLETGGYALFLGCKYENGGSASNFYDGQLEELVVYNRLIHPITPKDDSFLFEKPVSELNSAAEAVSKTYVARLFVKDYHNIRGASQNEVTVTPQISFRKAAFRLRTVE